MFRYAAKTKSKARAMRSEGLPQDDIAEACGVSQATVSRWTEDIPDPRDEVRTEKLRKALAMRAEGATTREIAAACRISQGSAFRWTRDTETPRDVARAKARELRATGLTLAEIAEKVDISIWTVRAWTMDIPVTPTRARTRRIREAMVPLIQAGMKGYEIAAQLGISPQGVSYYRKGLDIPVRLAEPQIEQACALRDEGYSWSMIAGELQVGAAAAQAAVTEREPALARLDPAELRERYRKREQFWRLLLKRFPQDDEDVKSIRDAQAAIPIERAKLKKRGELIAA